MKTGDVLISQRPSGDWSAVKILVVDRWPDGSEVFHCLLYKTVAERPSEDTLASLQILAMHAPIAAEGCREGWSVLCSGPVLEQELEGFHEYLKHTDFPRYISVTGQDARGLVSLANEHYRTACSLGDSGRREEAIKEYSTAIDIFPLFYEAIDNRAFTHMELGDYAMALQGFEESLRINSSGNSAFFSRGECLMKLGRIEEAAAVFQEGAERFPEHKDIYLRFLGALNPKLSDVDKGPDQEIGHKKNLPPAEHASKEKPWWRFW
jgi:tetratricopeptide (TPR) repeat protein